MNGKSGKTPVGQLVMPRIDFNEKGSVDLAKRLVDDYSVCGFIIFNGEIEQVRKTLSELRSRSDYPLLFGCDAERGLGQIVRGGTLFPFLMSQGAADAPELLKEQARITAEEMKYSGMNLLFAPVLDVNSNPANPIINIRSFSDNPALVYELGIEFIKVIQESGVISCAKHFPGHGDCNTDSHVSMPEVKKSREDLLELELIPFIKTVNEGLLSIMLAHVNYKTLDPDKSPATLSEEIIKNMLRGEIGFRGLIISDSFRMDALRNFGTEGGVAVRSIKAGCDIILDPTDPFSVIGKLNSSMQTDEEMFKCIDDQSDFVIKFKENNVGNESFLIKKTDDEKNKVVNDICERSICRLKGGTMKAGDADVVVADIAEFGKSVSEPFITELENNSFSVNNIHFLTNEYVTDSLKGIERSMNTIFLLFTSVRAWKKYTFLSEKLLNTLFEYMDGRKNTAVISFGSPYVMNQFKDVDIKIAAFDSLPPCQIAAARALTGKLGIVGKMPVNII